MKDCLLPIAGLAATLVFAANFVAQTRPQTSKVQREQTRDTAANLEAQIARLQVERTGLLCQYTPVSQPVTTANQTL